jgi:putative ABC transport system substrate-binding protein
MAGPQVCHMRRSTKILLPPPLWGRVGEGGDASGTKFAFRTTPTPNPSPQGGGEHGLVRIARREFIALLGGAAAMPVVAPLAAHAQQPATPARIGLLSPFSPAATEVWHKALRQGLRELGWIEGKNLQVEYRYANGDVARLPELAAELVRLRVQLIVASVNTDAVVAKKATQTIPIVVAAAGDAVGAGLVKSLAQPGGNITGLSQIAPELAGKRLQLLKELLPKLARVAVFWNPQGTTSPLAWREMQAPAQQLAVQLQSIPIRSAKEFDKAFADAVSADALVITPHPLFAGNLTRIAAVAAKARLPSMFHIKEYPQAGGLLAYGVDRAHMFQRAASYVDRILKGANPADLPVEQPTKFELVINLKTARALGLGVPANLIALADEVIE